MKLLARTIVPSLLLFSCALLCRAQSAATTQPRQDAPQPAALTPGEWKEFAPAGGGFSILFPGTPQLATSTKRINDRLSVEMRAYILNRPPLECGVAYADYPIRVGDPAAARALLDSAAKSATANGGRLLSFTEIEHEGHAGRMLRGRRPTGNLLRNKSVLVGARKYEIACTTPPPDGASAEALRQYDDVVAKFIDSFKLTPANAPGTSQPSGPSGPVGTVGPPQGVPDDAVPVALDAAQPGEVDQYLADHPGEVHFRMREGGVGRMEAAGETISMSRVAEGKTVSKPQPAYPAVARAARVSGAVAVMVVVDEEGKVVAAQAHSGHPLLRPPAVKAAREARFTPTLIDGKPVKVSGTITYNFNLK